MKKYYMHICALFICSLAFYACEEDKVDHSTTLTPFDYISGDFSVTINPQDEVDYFTLKWEPSSAADYSKVGYQVLFIKEGGDFNTPGYTITPDNKGFVDTLNLSHKQLNVIAELCGIKQNTTAKLLWKVMASNGVERLFKDTYRSITVTRPNGFAQIPEAIYLYGSATLAGENINNALLMQKSSVIEETVQPSGTTYTVKSLNGVFDIFTTFSAGTYIFVSNTTKVHRSFYIQNGKIEEGINPVITPAESAKPYRIRLNFNTSEANVYEITAVDFWDVTTKTVIGNMTYQNNGIWKISNYVVPVARASEYKFRLTQKESSSGAENYTFWGSNAKQASNPTEPIQASYYYTYNYDVDSGFAYRYSTEQRSTAQETKKADISLYMTGSQYHVQLQMLTE